MSVNTPNNYYVATNSGLASQVSNKNLHSEVGSNGRYGTSGQYPSNSYQNSNYFRDVVFVPSSLPSGSGTGVSISVTPATTTVVAGGTVQFTAAVSGSSNTAVTWSVTGGSISPSGLFTAPSTAGTYTVKATSAADSTKSATASVTVTTAPTVAVSISPSTATVKTGATQQFAATVTGTSNTGVTWSASGGTISSSGMYTAPSQQRKLYGEGNQHCGYDEVGIRKRYRYHCSGNDRSLAECAELQQYCGEQQFNSDAHDIKHRRLEPLGDQRDGERKRVQCFGRYVPDDDRCRSVGELDR